MKYDFSKQSHIWSFFSLHQLFCDCDYSNKRDCTAGQNSAVLTSLLNPLPDQKISEESAFPFERP